MELYRDSKVLSVRGLYVLQCVLRRHRLPFQISTKRRADIVIPPVRHKTAFAKRQFTYLSYSLYNQINKLLQVHKLNYHQCKDMVKVWLMKQSYDETEKLLLTQS
ncbi:hypothetical protein PYW07_006142 [Mythimna separata]|nr:hypothetical protein PYW07_006131 [Mythimna separata]KAJ8718212.1 hypothetical protein PYW07_006142 [Mythimna separata]